jgi:hypothetical protein
MCDPMKVILSRGNYLCHGFRPNPDVPGLTHDPLTAARQSHGPGTLNIRPIVNTGNLGSLSTIVSKE